MQYLYELSRETRGVLEVEVTHHTDMFYRLHYDRDSSEFGRRRFTVRVASEGDVFLSAYLGAQEHKVGRVGEAALKAMLESERASEILAKWKNRAERIPKCRSCHYKPICKGGSPVLAYSSHKTFAQPDDDCDARIRLFDELVDRAVAG